jgi:plastocyanin
MLVVSTAAAGAAGVALVGCGGGEDDASDNGDGGNGSVSGDPITIVMKDNFFEPRDITVPANTTIQITAENEGVAIHNMHVLSEETEGEDFRSDMIVNPSASSTFEVTFTQKGEVDFQCDYHLPDMVGTITVK